jgi:hypothetical protein
VEGRWCYGEIVEGEHITRGNNVFYSLDDSGAWIGSFVGYSSDDGKIKVDQSGNIFFRSTMTLESVTVDGKTGGLVMRAKGFLPAGGEFSDYSGTWMIIKSTGGLRGLRGRGTWGGVVFGNPDCSAIDGGMFIASVPYTGKIHFKNE